jgi:hypothetical protein
MPSILIGGYVHTDALVLELHDKLTREEVVQFILDLDLEYADLQFTETLYGRLGDVLREELESSE